MLTTCTFLFSQISTLPALYPALKPARHRFGSKIPRRSTISIKTNITRISLQPISLYCIVFNYSYSLSTLILSQPPYLFYTNSQFPYISITAFDPKCINSQSNNSSNALNSTETFNARTALAVSQQQFATNILQQFPFVSSHSFSSSFNLSQSSQSISSISSCFIESHIVSMAFDPKFNNSQNSPNIFNSTKTFDIRTALHVTQQQFQPIMSGTNNNSDAQNNTHSSSFPPTDTVTTHTNENTQTQNNSVTENSFQTSGRFSDKTVTVPNIVTPINPNTPQTNWL